MPYRFVEFPGFVELELSGVLEALEHLTSDEWASIRDRGALLYNYDRVEDIRYDPWVMSRELRRTAASGLRIAAYASSPAWYGVNRQLFQFAGTDDARVRLFRDRADAVRWLEAAG